ncbi:MAG TPA: NAD(P)H-dependent oxidoreductase [Spirochaetia bacterium]|nr:NAD(P)H-dependent oxidoreductase [Spirochaetia bacterium]
MKPRMIETPAFLRSVWVFMPYGSTIGGLRCAGDNRCRVEDDWPEVASAMLEADAIVFGAPAYYGMINALGHACLERTYSFRHRERFLLAGKLGLAVDVGRDEGDRPVRRFVESMFRSNMMAVVGSARADGSSQCYTCGYGADCAVGNVVATHGYLERIEPCHLPPEFDEQPDAVAAARKAGRVLGSMLRGRADRSERGAS